MKTYRACYYVHPETGQETVLTLPEQAALSDDELLEAAVAEARNAGLIDEDGEWPRLSEAQLRAGLEIGNWSD